MNDAPAPRDEAPEPESLDLESLEGLAGGAETEDSDFNFTVN
jgi:hypothetical protein